MADRFTLKKLNCSTAEQYLNKVMLAGEIERLAREIFVFSGFGQNINELIEEAKN